MVSKKTACMMIESKIKNLEIQIDQLLTIRNRFIEEIGQEDALPVLETENHVNGEEGFSQPPYFDKLEKIEKEIRSAPDTQDKMTTGKDAPQPGKGTILIVDDEDFILDVGKQMVTALGYQALLAESGEQALSLFKDHEKKIDLVILDMVMPYMDGGETFDKLKAMDPDVKVLLSSGYSLEGQATEIIKRGCKGFLQKPFNLTALSNKIIEIMKD